MHSAQNLSPPHETTQIQHKPAPTVASAALCAFDPRPAPFAAPPRPANSPTATRCDPQAPPAASCLSPSRGIAWPSRWPRIRDACSQPNYLGRSTPKTTLAGPSSGSKKKKKNKKTHAPRLVAEAAHMNTRRDHTPPWRPFAKVASSRLSALRPSFSPHRTAVDNAAHRKRSAGSLPQARQTLPTAIRIVVTGWGVGGLGPILPVAVLSALDAGSARPFRPHQGDRSLFKSWVSSPLITPIPSGSGLALRLTPVTQNRQQKKTQKTRNTGAQTQRGASDNPPQRVPPAERSEAAPLRFRNRQQKLSPDIQDEEKKAGSHPTSTTRRARAGPMSHAKTAVRSDFSSPWQAVRLQERSQFQILAPTKAPQRVLASNRPAIDRLTLP